jgi:hypothetical protein
LANLANFSYDPKNMEDLRMLQVTDLFLDMLTEDNENFVEFGMGEREKHTQCMSIIARVVLNMQTASPLWNNLFKKCFTNERTVVEQG